MRDRVRVFGLLLSLLLIAALTVSCGKKATVKGEGEEVTAEETEKPTEIREEVVSIPEKVTEETVVAKAEEEEVTEITFENIQFDFDKYFIREDARPILEKLGSFMTDNPDVKILIEGHCDERGTNEYNFALGERRSQAAMDYLVNLAIDAGRIKTISYGEERPLDPGHSEASWAQNRRAQFVILK
ncbi:MAG: peptidoglycan-associated lipoprotein Pal [Deltaproteobacteria bacterium]|nr:peptidoglycan-associated lipoprotein Pal [Deltaproteobacteria bacterium]NIS77075.1 peptidoglycan-associated lipoprotein Pal [Deltaproteobacteria bacterium]